MGNGYGLDDDTYPYPCLTREVDGGTVEILGVNHTEEFFDRYSDFFDDYLDGFDAAVLEASDTDPFWKTEFYRHIGEINDAYDQPVYQADPANTFATHADHGVAAYTGVHAVHGLVELGAAGLSLLNGDTDVYDTVRESIGELPETYLFLGSLLGVYTRMKLREVTGLLDDSEIETDDFGNEVLYWGNTDYRNIVIADGIESILEEDGTDTLASIHGVGHTDSIAFYLDHPGIRRVKKALYLPYQLLSIGSNSVSKYVSGDGGWQLDTKL